MGNGTRAFAIPAQQQPEQDNPLRTAEMTLEDGYGMIDGVINNGRRQYNRLCKGCVHPCKQSFRAVVLDCPHFQSQRVKKGVDKGGERAK